ncbi:lipid binding protein [Coprinopsis sp. MPI-PUGE-AT-0042]|nr:lipid binding protein [Coprinopsis sp. MPI-PUGE-AT-0042]
MDDDVFDNITWESPSGPGYDDLDEHAALGPGFRQSTSEGNDDPLQPKWEGYLITAVRDPVKELGETKDAYVSYLVTAKTNLPIFSTPNPNSRRRFQDFVFLRENLARDFPACVVPSLPDKHRLGAFKEKLALRSQLMVKSPPEYITGDRFSPEFMERRRADLHRFLQRISRHPILQRSTLLRAFFESTEWHVYMHQHVAHPPTQEPAAGLMDNLSDTLLNAFSRVRKPDERFLVMRENVDKFEEGLTAMERLYTKVRNRTSDLTADYHDLAVAVQGLGFLESGITDPLNHFSNTLLEFSALLRHLSQTTTDPLLVQLHSLLTYSHANRAVLRLRDQKQLDTEDLSDYLSGVTAERDRLSAIISGHAGSSGLGLGAYLKDRVDALRGADDDRSRVEKMKKLDAKIKELQDAVTTAHETSDAFNDATLREQTIFRHAKQAEMKDTLSELADGQIEFYKAAMEEWDRVIPVIQRIRVDV